MFPFYHFYLFLGIEFLVENGLLRMDPQDVAQFLYKGEGLNKTAIGKFVTHQVLVITDMAENFSVSVLFLFICLIV